MRIIGESSAFKRSSVLIMKAARSDSPVLILGETGTGKELVARQLHEASRRRAKPYVIINCASLSEAVLESELFGHVRGAFTGAHLSRRGRLEEASGGTVFLDEIAELTPACQAKLLRTLDSGEIIPLGSNKTRGIDVRFISATNQCLETLIQDGKFREDLYYRLRGMQIELPPLRRRRGDTELLANFFLAQEADLQEARVGGFSPEALDLIKSHDWPGNIRELKRVIASAVTLAEGDRIEAHDLPLSLHERGVSAEAAELAAPGESERKRISEALRRTAYPGTGRWNIAAAARALRINPHTLAYKVNKVYKLRPEIDV